MTSCRNYRKAVGPVLAIYLALFVFITSANCAVAPLLSNLPGITKGTSTPIRLATDSSGAVYVTDPRAGGVLKYDGAGKLLQTFPAAASIQGIAIAQNGDLLVTQGTYVALLDKTSGAEKGRFGTFGKANGITLDSSGSVYVTDSVNNCVQVFSSAYAPVSTGAASAGKPDNSFGSDGRSSGQFLKPTGISFEKQSGQLAVVDTFNGRIQFFSTAGAFQKTLGAFGGGPLQFTSPQAIAFEYNPADSSLRRIYVADAFQATIQVIDPATSTFLNYVGSYGLKAGELLTPGDILFDASDPLNNRLLASNGNGTVVAFGIDMVTGTCGAANAGSFATAPATDLCRNGFLAGFTGSGPWNWSCTGLYGGASASCSAQPLTHQISVTVAGNNGGSGSVTSNPAGINCLSGVCSKAFTAASSVQLLPLADSGSSFTGWTGDCSGTSNCILSLSADHSATATFDLIPRVRVGTTPFGTLASAYAAVTANGTVEAQSLSFVENLILNRGLFFTLLGGNDTSYSNRTGYTELSGTLTISTGGLVVDRLVIK